MIARPMMMAVKAAALIAMASLAGCAVLTIDVDVYKGPLADEETVQVQRLAAMAMGAKPLLVDLRWELEKSSLRKHPGDTLNIRRLGGAEFKSVESGATYAATDYIPEGVYDVCEVTDLRLFNDSQARRVNEVLSLYEDAIPPSLAPLFVSGRAAIRDIEHAAAILQPDTRTLESDRALWDRLRRAMVSDKRDSGLADAYEALLVAPAPGKYRDQDQLFDHVRNTAIMRETPDRRALAACGCAEEMPANLQFEVLADRSAGSMVSEHARVLFADSAPGELAEFAGRVREIADAYLRARLRLSELLAATLYGVEAINAEGAQISDGERYALEQLAAGLIPVLIDFEQLGQLPESELWERLDGDVKTTIGGLAAIMPPSTGSVAAADGSVPASADAPVSPEVSTQPDGSVRLLTDSAEQTPKPAPVAVSPELPEQTAASDPEFSLQRQFSADPTGTARVLMGLHLGLIDGWRSSVDESGAKLRASAAFSRYGIVKGPLSRGGTDDFNLNEALDAVKKTFAKYEGSLGGGRLAYGIETLIDLYLAALSSTDDPDDPRVQAALADLTEALVRFSEKILFIANSDPLLSGASAKELGLGLGSVVAGARVLGGDYATDPVLAGLEQLGLKDSGPDNSYIRVLQAVGNSILVAADELRQRDRHRAWLGGPARAEAQAFVREYRTREKDVKSESGKGAAKTQDANDSQAASKSTDPKTEQSEEDARVIIDALHATLVARRAQMIEQHGTEYSGVKQLTDALDAVDQYRSGLVYIRPASAYLRSSYPATTLQGDPGLRWGNMLGDHALRSVPFAPQIRDFADPIGARSAQITAEIDKQFWQTVNRVRVAGGGDTNYAVVKDDIGNWYVKRYSGDPRKVINSARNLASLHARGLSIPEIKQGDADDEDPKNPVTAGIAYAASKSLEEYNAGIDKEFASLKGGLIRTRLNNVIDSRSYWDTDAPGLRTEIRKGMEAQLQQALTPVWERPAATSEERLVRTLDLIKAMPTLLEDLGDEFETASRVAADAEIARRRAAENEKQAEVSDSDSDSDAGTDAGTDADSDAGTDADTDADTDAGADTGTGTGTDTDTDTDTDADTDRDSVPVSAIDAAGIKTAYLELAGQAHSDAVQEIVKLARRSWSAARTPPTSTTSRSTSTQMPSASRT